MAGPDSSPLSPPIFRPLRLHFALRLPLGLTSSVRVPAGQAVRLDPARAAAGAPGRALASLPPLRLGQPQVSRAAPRPLLSPLAPPLRCALPANPALNRTLTRTRALCPPLRRSLVSVPEQQGVDVQQALRSFHEQRYSAHLMTVRASFIFYFILFGFWFFWFFFDAARCGGARAYPRAPRTTLVPAHPACVPTPPPRARAHLPPPSRGAPGGKTKPKTKKKRKTGGGAGQGAA